MNKLHAFHINALSRQRRWQIIRRNKGLCPYCGGQPLHLCGPCPKCRDRRNTVARNRYRRLHGIPMEAPLWTRAKTQSPVGDTPRTGPRMNQEPKRLGEGEPETKGCQ